MPEGWSYDAHLDRFVKVGDSHAVHVPMGEHTAVHHTAVHHIHVVHGPEDVTFHQPSSGYDCAAGVHNWQALGLLSTCG